MKSLGLLPITLLFLAQLLVSLSFLIPDFANTQAFADLLAHPQFWGALKLSIGTGIVSTGLALLFALLITSGQHTNLQRQASVFLSVPHLAFAIGLAFFIAPTGAIARAIGTLAGWAVPPQWITVQDPYGLALTAALVLKETPFLVWALASLLSRDDLKQQFARHTAIAKSLGHGSFSIWLSITLPQLLPRIFWPLVAVFTYGCTVVDMAIAIGPTQPPTLANLIWSDLNDGERVHNARGAVGVLTLSTVILNLLLVVGLLLRLTAPLVKILLLQYPPTRNLPNRISDQIWTVWRVFYSLIVLFIFLASFSGFWPFPHLWPDSLTTKSWLQLGHDARPVIVSFILASATSATAIAACLFWLETQPSSRDKPILAAAAVSLCLPALVIGLGQYRLFLALGITGTALAMFLAHLLPVMAYVIIMLCAPYRAYDARWRSVSSGLLQTRWRFLTAVKWPMLKAPILSAAAVGFAVSFAQYVPAQLASAGRYTTLPIEAVTLTSGGTRSLIATYALAMMALPLFVFLAASWWSRPRYA